MDGITAFGALDFHLENIQMPVTSLRFQNLIETLLLHLDTLAKHVRSLKLSSTTVLWKTINWYCHT